MPKHKVGLKLKYKSGASGKAVIASYYSRRNRNHLHLSNSLIDSVYDSIMLERISIQSTSMKVDPDRLKFNISYRCEN